MKTLIRLGGCHFVGFVMRQLISFGQDEELIKFGDLDLIFNVTLGHELFKQKGLSTWHLRN